MRTIKTLTILLLAVVVIAGVASVAYARVVRQAPDFTWTALDGSNRTLASLAGQPVMLIIAPSPRDRRFRAQMRELQSAYQRVAAARMITTAAFTSEAGRIDSNIPVVVAADGPRVAFLYEVPEGFSVAMIGSDGNLDYLTNQVIPVQRVLDIIDASYARQEYLRRP
jgi:hypothetical protein